MNQILSYKLANMYTLMAAEALAQGDERAAHDALRIAQRLRKRLQHRAAIKKQRIARLGGVAS